MWLLRRAGLNLRQSLKRSLRHSARGFILCALAGMGALVMLFCAVIYDSYRNAWAWSSQAASNVAVLVEQDISRDIEVFGLSLQAVVDGVGDQDVMRQPPQIRQEILFNHALTAKGMGSILVLDATGSVVLDSRSVTPRSGNFADRDYFQVHRDSMHDVGLFISKPFRARLVDNAWSIGVSRRLSHADGSFAGVAIGTVRIDYLNGLFRDIALGSRGTIGLFNTDGTLIACFGTSGDETGMDRHTAPVFGYLKQNRAGSFVSDHEIDQRGRLYIYRRLGTLPLVLTVGMSVDDMLAPWRRRTIATALIFVAMAAAVLFMMFLLGMELRQRTAAEQMLSKLATTDGLTGLANRRRFDEVLASEWSRACREGSPFACLLIDGDFFKTFNDTYGHQSGDVALRGLAAAIRDAVRRPSDLAARYGGEEFAVLLPHTDLNGALVLAEAIRRAVLALAIPHSASKDGVLTVSIGAACVRPRPGAVTADFLRAADVALYRAKGLGRNRVSYVQDGRLGAPHADPAERLSA